MLIDVAGDETGSVDVEFFGAPARVSSGARAHRAAHRRLGGAGGRATRAARRPRDPPGDRLRIARLSRPPATRPQTSRDLTRRILRVVGGARSADHADQWFIFRPLWDTAASSATRAPRGRGSEMSEVSSRAFACGSTTSMLLVVHTIGRLPLRYRYGIARRGQRPRLRLATFNPRSGPQQRAPRARPARNRRGGRSRRAASAPATRAATTPTSLACTAWTCGSSTSATSSSRDLSYVMEAQAQGRGVVMASAHYANPEFATQGLAEAGVEVFATRRATPAAAASRPDVSACAPCTGTATSRRTSRA